MKQGNNDVGSAGDFDFRLDTVFRRKACEKGVKARLKVNGEIGTPKLGKPFAIAVSDGSRIAVALSKRFCAFIEAEPLDFAAGLQFRAILQVQLVVIAWGNLVDLAAAKELVEPVAGDCCAQAHPLVQECTASISPEKTTVPYEFLKGCRRGWCHDSHMGKHQKAVLA